MRRSPKDTDSSSRIVTRRGLILGGAQVGFMGILALRMRYMQVEQADQFRLLAEENRVNIRLIPPARGLIHDRDGRLIADNEQNYRIVITREDAGDAEETLSRLSRLIELTDEQKADVLKEMRKTAPHLPVTIIDRVSWETLSKVAVNSPALPGVHPEVGLSRHYPLTDDFAHIVGYVGPVSDYDLSKIENPDQLLLIPRFQIGKVGIETKMEKTLRGNAGLKRLEVNAAGRVMRELSREPGVAGSDIQLTIDHRLQNFVQARLGGESAAVVVMDTTTGDILASGSAPSFDPNKFVRGISVADYSELTENEYRPLSNKAVQGEYPPGSTFKMVTALAALEAGVVTTDETIYCPGHTTVGGRRFHCWKGAGHGWVDLNESLYQSCDVYFYGLAQRVGIENISKMAVRLGFGQRFDLPMSAIADGRAPTKQWKLDRFGKDWVIGDSLNAGIGQGFVLASPLQLAVMSARLASGKAVMPRLIKSIDGVEQPIAETEELAINENHLRAVRRGMINVSNLRRGTAYSSRIDLDEMKMAGKTGTSQVRNITAAERARGVVNNRDLPWNRRDHALFVSFAPIQNPRIAVSVVVEHGMGGSLAAAPIARDVVLAALNGGVPPIEAYPKSQREKIGNMLDALPLREPSVEKDKRSRA